MSDTHDEAATLTLREWSPLSGGYYCIMSLDVESAR